MPDLDLHSSRAAQSSPCLGGGQKYPGEGALLHWLAATPTKPSSRGPYKTVEKECIYSSRGEEDGIDGQCQYELWQTLAKSWGIDSQKAACNAYCDVIQGWSYLVVDKLVKQDHCAYDKLVGQQRENVPVQQNKLWWVRSLERWQAKNEQ